MGKTAEEERPLPTSNLELSLKPLKLSPSPLLQKSLLSDSHSSPGSFRFLSHQSNDITSPLLLNEWVRVRRCWKKARSPGVSLRRLWRRHAFIDVICGLLHLRSPSKRTWILLPLLLGFPSVGTQMCPEAGHRDELSTGSIDGHPLGSPEGPGRYKNRSVDPGDVKYTGTCVAILSKTIRLTEVCACACACMWGLKTGPAGILQMLSM